MTVHGDGEAYRVCEGSSPVILAQPHVGTELLPGMRERLSDTGRQLADTDWHVDRLYADLLPRATTVQGVLSRLVIDLNRDPGGHSLYPGQNTTELCPRVDFDGRDLYRDATVQPTDHEIARRREEIHQPYHEEIARQIRRLRQEHPHVLLFDCHSIRSRLPFLFSGTLPLLNLGTFDGRSCDAMVEEAATRFCAERVAPSDWVLNGRFKGGFTVRHHAARQRGVHCFQLELAQRAYLEVEAPPWKLDDVKCEQLRPLLAELLSRLRKTVADLAASVVALPLARLGDESEKCEREESA